ncbi:chemotaxis protein CheW [Bacillus sp. RG28]|uniref:Chemotaxis protein CheW n=1 Tax=Gottfriedia endophytica TaxID=2820819 RepID=A0A940NRH6_9BACI|nr:chemotaxis protein CheW [Gottfriedia endophytica]MBP0726218.1 chemotaxis protein CheW [Gottfriedia endophytica]
MIAQEEKVIVFELNNEEYCIPVKFVKSIEKIQYITRVPKVEPFVKGVINLRGVVTPIIDLRLRFDFPELPFNEQTRIIIVSINEKEVGFIVDSANDVLDVEQSQIESAPEVVGEIERDYIKGVAKLDKRLLILLDLENILDPSYETNTNV